MNNNIPNWILTLTTLRRHITRNWPAFDGSTQGHRMKKLRTEICNSKFNSKLNSKLNSKFNSYLIPNSMFRGDSQILNYSHAGHKFPKVFWQSPLTNPLKANIDACPSVLWTRSERIWKREPPFVCELETCALSCAILLPVDVIAFGRVWRVVIGGYVAGKNLDWYLCHKYAHNAYNCPRRSR